MDSLAGSGVHLAGRWIWSDDDGDALNQWRWFRAEFAAPHAGEPAVLSISADTRYRVWLDGQLVGDGPSSGVPWRQLVDRYDLGPLDPSETHCLAVVVNATGCYPRATRGGLLAEVRAGREVLLASGEGWRVAHAVAYASRTPAAQSNRTRPFAVIEDRRLEPAGWRLAGFADDGWPAAVLVPHGDPESAARPMPWTRLVHEPLPASGLVFMPLRVERVEECLDLDGRGDPAHLITGLAQPGRSVRAAQVHDPEALLAPGDGAVGDGAARVGGAVLRCSSPGLDGVYDPCLTLDFGTIRCARIELEVSGPSGAVVDLGFAERLVDGWFTNSVEGPFAERVIMTGGRQVLRCWHWQAFRFVRVRVRRCWEGLTIHRFTAVDVTAALADDGGFDGRPELAAVERICRATLRLSTVEGIVDTPWRESARWLGDGAAVTASGLRACFGDRVVTDAFFRRAAACQLPSGLLAGVSNAPELNPGQAFADFSLWWLIGMWRQYLWAGDDSLIRDHYGQALRIVAAFERAPDGLLAPTAFPVFIDWSPIRRHGRLAFLNALFAEALQSLSSMADLVGDRPTAARARHDQEGLVRSFADHFVDPAAGVVVDVADQPAAAGLVSETANAAAVAFGLVDERVADRIVARLWDAPPAIAVEWDVVEAEPFGTALVLQALARRGNLEAALRIVAERWGRMIERGASTTFEEWSCNRSLRSGTHRGFLRSLSHAWSAYPAEFLIKDVPGIAIMEPGCRRLRITPPHLRESFVARFPTPLGVVVVRHCDEQTTVTAPEGIVIDVPPGVRCTTTGPT